MYDEDEIEELLHPKSVEQYILETLESIAQLIDKQNKILFDISNTLKKRK